MTWLEKYRFVLAAVLGLIALAGVGFVYWRPVETGDRVEIILPTTPVTATLGPSPTATATLTPAPTATPAPLRVYVSGAVPAPDVYELPPGSIIKDALAAAGGPTEDADLVAVNLALAVQDQQQVHIPARAAELPTPPVTSGGVTPTPSPAPETGSASETNDASTAGVMLNINTATIQQLQLLPGVGPAIAERIVAYREENGDFPDIGSIRNVKGIGPATFAKFEANIKVE